MTINFNDRIALAAWFDAFIADCADWEMCEAYAELAYGLEIGLSDDEIKGNVIGACEMAA
jgi:hypothetical protein